MLSANTGYITSGEELWQLAQKVIGDGLPIALDCETGYEGEDRGYKNSSPSLHPEESILAGYNFTNAVSWGRYVPLGHDDSRYNIDPVPAARALWDMTATGLCIAHNADMEERTLSRWMLEHLADDPQRGAAVRASRGYFPILSDTMMEAHALARWKSIALKYLSRQVFDYDQVELRDLFSEILGKTVPANKRYTLRFTVLDPSDPRVFNYACDDVIQTLRLHQRHYPQVKDNFIYWLEMNVWPVIWAMEDEGLAVDWDYIDEAKGRARQFRNKMQAGIVNHLTERLGQLPPKFNPGSHPQVRRVLYSKPPEGLGLMTHIMTKGKKDGTDKKLSTSALALKGNSFDPFVRRMQDFRGMSKLLSTYLENWRREYGWCDDGRAHCHLLPHGTFTGRCSSSDFNYQNLPKKYHYECEVNGEVAEFSFNFRDCVVVPDGFWGMGFDISQGELRIIAAEAGEQAMLDAFANGEDLHALTACRLLNLTREEMLAGGELGGKQYPAEAGGFRPFGKAQPLSEPVLTPDGWTRMGGLKVGDYVFGSDGFPVRIRGVFPQGVKKVYRVTTSDGAVTECCEEHLWTVRNINSKDGGWRTYELRELMASGLHNTNGQPKFVLPSRSVIQYPDSQELDVDPYVMGLLLGDGGFTQVISFTNQDQELLQAVRSEHERSGGRVREKDRGSRVRLLLDAGVPYQRTSNVIRRALRRHGLLGLKSHEKFVPPEYMQASPAQRLWMLQGLLDTDGNVLASGAQFRVTSEQLAKDAQALARSLGGWASIKTYQRERTAFHTKSDPLPTWDVYLRLPDGMCPFRLARKRERWKPPRYVADQRIVSVEEVMSSEVQCISVDAQDGLYVTSDYIVTHNTMNFARSPWATSSPCRGWPTGSAARSMRRPSTSTTTSRCTRRSARGRGARCPTPRSTASPRAASAAGTPSGRTSRTSRGCTRAGSARRAMPRYKAAWRT